MSSAWAACIFRKQSPAKFTEVYIMERIDRVISEGEQLNVIRKLFREYETELAADLYFQDFEAELADPLKKYGCPDGTLLLAYWIDQPAGCIALRSMKEVGYCEMKRLFVRPEYRKFGIGKTLVNLLIEFAQSNGYAFMRLDTFKKLQAAIRLYQAEGFYFIESYYPNPYPDVVYMEKRLLET